MPYFKEGVINVSFRKDSWKRWKLITKEEEN
jgi:hypothetical protein